LGESREKGGKKSKKKAKKASFNPKKKHWSLVWYNQRGSILNGEILKMRWAWAIRPKKKKRLVKLKKKIGVDKELLKGVQNKQKKPGKQTSLIFFFQQREGGGGECP